MQSKDTKRRLDQIAKSERSYFLLALIGCIGLALVFEILGYFPRSDLGNAVATVTWSEVAVRSKEPPWTNIRADLDGGKHISITSPHIPPPVPGDKIVVQVRRNIIGYHSYKWIVGKRPALTPPPGSL
jgi:hypothetical protein